MPTDESKQAIVRLIDTALLSGQDDSVHNLMNGVIQLARSKGMVFDGRTALEYFWDLARCGIIAVPGGSIGSLPGKFPQLVLTARGRKLLETGECSPHDPSRYVEALRVRVSQPDDVVLSYVEESAEAWRCGLSRSSAVMLGCACERLVLLLADALAASILQPFAQKIRAKLDSRVFISGLFNDVLDALRILRDQGKVPRDTADAFDRKMTPIFDYARGLRNQSGHPTGAIVTREDAEAGLLLFPGFCELMCKLIALVKAS